MGTDTGMSSGQGSVVHSSIAYVCLVFLISPLPLLWHCLNYSSGLAYICIIFVSLYSIEVCVVKELLKSVLHIFQYGEHFYLLGWQLLCKLFSSF